MDDDCEANSFDKLYPRVIDRYYQKHYYIDGLPEDRKYGILLQHSNNLFVLFISKDHFIFDDPCDTPKFEFVAKAANMRLSGKRKHGSVRFRAGEKIATITCSDKTVDFLCPIECDLLEVNCNLSAERLFASPEGDEQYFAILVTKNIEKSLSNVIPAAEIGDRIHSRA